MMKMTLLVSLVALGFAYDDIDDNHDFKTLLTDRDMLRELYECMIDEGPCSDFNQILKSHTKEAALDGCAECDPVQKHYAHELANALREKYPELFQKFQAKFDPTGKIFPVFEKAIENY